MPLEEKNSPSGKTQDPKSDQNSKEKSVMECLNDMQKPEAAKDPLRTMIDILKDDNLNREDKIQLIQFARNRFKNRRRMAYIAFSTIILSMILLFVGAFCDGFGNSEILKVVDTNSDLFIWGNFFLTAIVGAYYGVSAWRPSS